MEPADIYTTRPKAIIEKRTKENRLPYFVILFRYIGIALIIVVLFLIATVGVQPPEYRHRIENRDARKISDMRQVYQGLGLYFSKMGKYPEDNFTAMKTTLIGANIGVTRALDDFNADFGLSYLYATNASGSTYVLGATLEEVNSPVLKNDLDGSILGINCNDPVFCVSPNSNPPWPHL